MNRVNCAVLLVSSCITAAAQEAMAPAETHLEKTTLEVAACLEVGTSGNFGAIEMGKLIASQVFEQIGVKLRWSCSGDFILVKLAGNTPQHVHEGALGYARPYANAGVRVVVFYDRFESLVMSSPLSGSAILGYVFAHEIGHVLSGVAAHGGRGLMRAGWSSEDFHSMGQRALEFAPEDAELIRMNAGRGFGQRARAEPAQPGAKTSSNVD